MEKLGKEKGLTLIALIVTIIVLLILAGIVLSLTLGKKGVILKAQEAGIKNEEAQAREKLELALLDLQADKIISATYNEKEYIDTYLSNRQMAVIGDIVIVNGWQFQINRSVPQIAISLGRGQENEEIGLSAKAENALDYTKATLKLEITYEGELGSIQINGENIPIPEKQNGKYIIEKEILQNGNYTIVVKDVNEGYKIATSNITEIAEDMNIYTAEDMVKFRNHVNKGATYINKTIQVMDKIDLSSVCGENINGQEVSWEPIGNYGTDTTHIFKGTFNGNNHTIDNLYINSTSDYQGLFGYVQEGNIEGVVIGENSSIKGGNLYIGGIAGYIDDTSITNCGNNADITDSGGYVGGIAGYSNNSKIIGTYNKGNINASSGGVAGITGTMMPSTSEHVIKYSYNTGDITGKHQVGGISGDGWDNTEIYNCYNIGKIKTIGKNPGNCTWTRWHYRKVKR